MVNQRASSFYKSSTIANRRKSPLSFSIYTVILFAFSIFIFFFYTKDILEDENEDPLLFSSESESENVLQMQDETLWEASFGSDLHPCVKPTTKFQASQGLDRYMTVRSNGGLNQMRAGIADMVAVAYILNATLVIPQLDKRSFWQDSSVFSDIFDETHFVTSLKEDVRILKNLPKELESTPRARKHFTSWSSMSYYEETRQLWEEYKVIHVVKSDSRLANNDLPLDIQRLRCRALYHALRFSPSIESLGKELVERLRSRAQRYVALHLRYEKDMLSFTGCTNGLSDTESEELRVMRENTNHWKIKNINATEQRLDGSCPLTPKEVGIFLRSMGYASSTLVYIAAGEIYGGNTRLSELTSRFPNVVSKEILATKEELNSFANHASQTAALDYIISIESDVFIPTHSGNMARAVEGHRRFLGHRKTITPDRRGLVELFDKLETGKIEDGPELSHLVKKLHKNRELQDIETKALQESKAEPVPDWKNPFTKILTQNVYVVRNQHTKDDMTSFAAPTSKLLVTKVTSIGSEDIASNCLVQILNIIHTSCNLLLAHLTSLSIHVNSASVHRSFGPLG